METSGFDYSSREWRALSARAIERDGDRCTVRRLLGRGPCDGLLHAHHIEPARDRPDLALDLDNVGTACARHHPMWEALRRTIVEGRLRALRVPVCPHTHRSAESRRQCERRLERQLARRAQLQLV